MTPTDHLEHLLPLLACPACRGTLARGAALTCAACARTYPIENGVPILLDEESRASISAARGAAENVVLRQRLSRSPLLLRVLSALRPPHPYSFMRWLVSRAKRADFSGLVSRASLDGACFLDIGSGVLGGHNASGLAAEVRERFVALEISPSSGVGVVGDAHKLPWKDASLHGVLIQGVLEHVFDPERIVAEILRVLKPGAPVYAEVPFLQHYHLDPLDFRRYTKYGFEHLFKEFETIDSGVCAGPASALTDILTEVPAVPFRSPAAYWAVKWVVGWLFCPIQLLDGLLWRATRAHITAGAVYYLGRKR